ncbi:MAG: aminotransferase class V-fold PLP-dependent enzyme [Chloroflexi bacterium]|jgi:8-amino-3,8-dideoxy-alpha-D-manno-octulosonate transaminase|nr:aminotransferase class V-fold PLP-dependent enzyme [Chloroflexota bacterium]
MADDMTRLAIDGGLPVRTEPLPAAYLGTSVLGGEEMELLMEVVRTHLPFREYGDGVPHMVKDLEREARAYFGVPYALGTATGSGSFFCAMAGLGVGPGDEVIIPSFGWYTDYEAPVMLGATPVFADIDRSMNMDPDDFERKITPRTKAVIVVYFQGAAHDMDRLLSIARAHGIAVVEDVAQACGATYHGRKLGSLGDVACFSLQQNKIMSTGDGGLLLAKDPIVFERAVRFHDLGFVRPSLAAQFDGQEQVAPFAGGQWRMNEFTGAVALAQLRKLDSHVLSVTRRYHRMLKGRLEDTCPGMRFRPVGDPEGDAGIALYMDMGTPAQAAWFAKALAAEGIRVGPSSGCTNLLHTPIVQTKAQAHPLLPPFGPGWPGEHVQYGPELCPNTDDILASLVCVALVPGFGERDVDDIGTAIIKVWQGRPKEIFLDA